MQDLNCTRNPTFCTAAFAQISTCTRDMLLGDAAVVIPQRWNGTAAVNISTTIHLKGQALLRASLKKLGELGLSGAEHVLLTGETHAGTTAALIADSVAAQLKTIAPQLKAVKVLPADGEPALTTTTTSSSSSSMWHWRTRKTAARMCRR